MTIIARNLGYRERTLRAAQAFLANGFEILYHDPGLDPKSLEAVTGVFYTTASMEGLENDARDAIKLLKSGISIVTLGDFGGNHAGFRITGAGLQSDEDFGRLNERLAYFREHYT